MRVVLARGARPGPDRAPIFHTDREHEARRGVNGAHWFPNPMGHGSELPRSARDWGDPCTRDSLAHH